MSIIVEFILVITFLNITQSYLTIDDPMIDLRNPACLSELGTKSSRLIALHCTPCFCVWKVMELRIP